MSTEPRIYVACLASYNAGKLHGAWIDANQDADDVWNEIRAILRSSPCPNVEVDCPTCDGAGKDSPMDGLATPSDDTCATCKGSGKVPSAEEWAIHDHEGFEGIKVGECANIAHVVKWAELIGEHDGAFAAWWANGTADTKDPDSWSDAFTEAYRGTWKSLADYAEQLMDDMGTLADVPDTLRNYFDYERWGRDLEMGGDIWTTDGGDGIYVFDNTV